MRPIFLVLLSLAELFNFRVYSYNFKWYVLNTELMSRNLLGTVAKLLFIKFRDFLPHTIFSRILTPFTFLDPHTTFYPPPLHFPQIFTPTTFDDPSHFRWPPTTFDDPLNILPKFYPHTILIIFYTI